MPACTGLPPGELISNTTACEPTSSKALRKAALISSALASEPLAISPLISTTAVCGALLVGVPSWLSSHQAIPPNKPSHNKRQNMRQRRVARCSAKVAKTNFSSTARSHPGAGAGAGGLLTGAARVDDVCEPHRSGAAWESGGAEPGR